MSNRRIFVQKLGSLFKSHADELAQVVDADVSCENRTSKTFDLLTHQKVVADYLNTYTPYRGLLIYHGLGSGKTCTSIAIAEGMKSDKEIVIMTPASLKTNFFSELKNAVTIFTVENNIGLKKCRQIEPRPILLPVLYI